MFAFTLPIEPRLSVPTVAPSTPAPSRLSGVQHFVHFHFEVSARLRIAVFLIAGVQELPAFGVVTEGNVGQADIAVGVGRVGRKFQDDFGILQRHLELIEVAIDLGAGLMGADVFGVELDRLGEIVQRLAVLCPHGTRPDR